ncbi:hypothetical protein K469DRAFT_706035 [Zopfia rhizophila CBS 207.26]|uniref:Uncharacterized protein n=1 Tax=Zopfia rhizophila CBS 207.26 TaxID=1314779 RepID=A0A6A6EXB9_9PEZI|nr:hypothetical protein K469DRAFT_706035 [Zopfia rhizophila CBS 207.26]
MTDLHGPILRDTVRMPGLEYCCSQSPLRVVNDDGFFRPDSQLKADSEILKDAFNGTEMICIEALHPETAADEAEFFNIRRDKFWNRLTRGEPTTTEDVSPLVKDKVVESIRLAGKIHFRAVAMRIQHDDQINTEDMKRLHMIIRKVDYGSWKIAHYVYLWILLTGGAAAHGHPEERPFFVSELMRFALSVGLLDWRAFRQTLGNFLWLQHFLRRDLERSTKENGEG